ncbi:hypothetical protein AHAS_Ahas20G0092000 [Arachis hypogaea]
MVQKMPGSMIQIETQSLYNGSEEVDGQWRSTSSITRGCKSEVRHMAGSVTTSNVPSGYWHLMRDIDGSHDDEPTRVQHKFSVEGCPKFSVE